MSLISARPPLTVGLVGGMSAEARLTAGVITDASRAIFLAEARGLEARGAEGIIPGCTEIPLILTPDVCDLPLLDTARIHASAALDVAMHEKGI